MTAERQSPASPQSAAIPQNPAVSKPGSHRARLRFERLPSAYCHHERLDKLLPDGLPQTFRDRLRTSTRLRLRLSALLSRRLSLPACTAEDLAAPEGRFAQLEGDDLAGALRQIGAIWHARAIRRVILAEPLRQLVERLGRDNHRAALRFIDLAPDPDAGDDRDVPDGGDAPDVDALLSSIERDGLIALNAWCRRQPAALALRLHLKLPPCPEADDEPPAGHRERGVAIVDRVMTSLAGSEPEAAAGHG